MRTLCCFFSPETRQSTRTDGPQNGPHRHRTRHPHGLSAHFHEQRPSGAHRRTPAAARGVGATEKRNARRIWPGDGRRPRRVNASAMRRRNGDGTSWRWNAHAKSWSSSAGTRTERRRNSTWKSSVALNFLLHKRINFDALLTHVSFTLSAFLFFRFSFSSLTLFFIQTRATNKLLTPPCRFGHWTKWKIVLMAKWRGKTGLVEKERK